MRLDEVSREFGVTCTGGKRARNFATCAVIHQTGGSTARGAADYLSTRPDGSVHVVVDNEEAYMTAPISTITCGVRDVNSWTWHVEQAGPFSWRLSDWRDNFRTVRRCAWHVARFLVAQGLPRRMLSVADINAGKRQGWTTHENLSLSVVSSSTHTDPVHYPVPLFRMYLRRFYRRFERDGVPPLKKVAS